MHLIRRMLAAASGLPAGKQITLRAERRQFLKRRWQATAQDGTGFEFDQNQRFSSTR